MGEAMPNGWKLVQLQDVAVDGPTNGYSPPSAPHARGSLSLKLSATTQGRLILNAATVKHLHETIPKDSWQWLEPGDLLVQRSNTAELVGTAAVYDGPPKSYVYPDLMMRLRFADPATTRWVWRYINSPAGRRFFTTMAAGAAGSMPKISGAKLKAMPVPLPSLFERRRIADILDKADAIRRKRKEAIALTEELLRSAFFEMFGDPVTNPKAWKVKPLGEVVERFEAGWSANGEARTHEPSEYGVLKISAVTSGFFRPDEHKAVAATDVDRELVTPRKGDLLFSRANTRELVAATCLVEEDHPRLFLPDKLWKVVPSASATAPFLRFLLAHERQRMELTKTATGTSGSMLNISMVKLRALMVPVPPIAIQERFAEIVWASLASRRTLVLAAQCADDLFASLVDRAFRGELSGTAKKQLELAGGELHP